MQTFHFCKGESYEPFPKDGFITKSEMSKVSKRLSKEQVDKVMMKQQQ